MSYRNGRRPIHFKDMRNTMLFFLSGPIGQVNPELNEKSYHVDEPSARILLIDQWQIYRTKATVTPRVVN